MNVIPINKTETPKMLVQQFATLTFQDRGYTDWWFDAGVGTGKTHIASRWIYKQTQEQPNRIIGFIGANDYDQLNQAVLPPLLEYLESKNIEWVLNKKPPRGWRVYSRFPKHNNILSLSTGHQFITKHMKENFHLAGVEIGYWWVDEIGDIPEKAFMILRERRRQKGANHVGLVTGTPNGPVHFSAKHYMNPGTRLPKHGYIVATTHEGVEAGWLTKEYYDVLKASYSKRKGQARLEGLVVDSEQLRAYESHDTELNCRQGNPFNGNRRGANPEHPIGVFCDFNSEKLCIWEVGQFDHKRTHIIDEIALDTNRVEKMTFELIRKYPNWYAGYHFFGDASGTRNELSSGMACFDKIKQIMSAKSLRCNVTVRKANPTKIDRIEAMNTALCSYDGQTTLTYDEKKCIHLHLDFLRVGFDGIKLLDGGDPDRTHASDGVGYHIVAVRPIRGPAFMPITGSGTYPGD